MGVEGGAVLWRKALEDLEVFALNAASKSRVGLKGGT